MRDQWEARIVAIENIQAEFGHDIQEIKEQLARLTSLLEDHIRIEVVHPRGQSPSPKQQVPKSYLPHRTDHPNLWQPRPTSPPTDLPDASRGKPNGQKFEKDKPRWDPIPITYTKLFPKLVKMGHIKPVQLAPLKLPFPRWYNARTQCDYHGGNPGHPTENCTALKYKVRDLISEGKLKFEDLDGSAEVEDSSRTKVEVPKQKEETPKEVNLEKATMPKEKVPIAKAGSSSTTEKVEGTIMQAKHEKGREKGAPRVGSGFGTNVR